MTVTVTEEAAEAAKAGFPRLWPVYEDYTLEKGRNILPAGKVARYYAPILHRELPSELACIREGDVDALMAFVRRYGLLGYQGFAGHVRQDPLPWVWAHVRTVRLIMDGLSILQRRDAEAADTLLAGLTPSRTEDGTPPLPAVLGAQGGDVILSTFQGRTALDTVGFMVKTLLGANVRGVNRVPLLEKARYIRSAFTYRAMVQVIYWHMLDAAEGGSLRVCAECHRPFIVTDNRQKFCPPAGWENESLCAMRYRQRKHRAAKKWGE